jgi:hypothetical protein
MRTTTTTKLYRRGQIHSVRRKLHHSRRFVVREEARRGEGARQEDDAFLGGKS